MNTSAVPSGTLAAGLARLGQDDGRVVNLALIALEGNPDALRTYTHLIPGCEDRAGEAIDTAFQLELPGTGTEPEQEA